MSGPLEAADGSGGTGNLASRPEYAAAFQRATTGTYEARQAAIRDMEIIASGGSASRPAPSPAPTAPANGAAAHRAAYDAVIKMPVGPARDAASLELATLALSSGPPLGYFRDRAALGAEAADPYGEAFRAAANPSAPSAARTAAIDAMERHAAAGGLASGEPAAPAVPEGYEAAPGLSSYAVPGLIAPDPDGMAKAMGEMLALHVPGWLGQTILREAAATVAMRENDTAFRAGLAQARATLTRLHGPDEAVALASRAMALIDRLPVSEERRHDMRGLLCSPTVILQLAQLDKLGAFPAGQA